jgi:protein SCO1/2
MREQYQGAWLLLLLFLLLFGRPVHIFGHDPSTAPLAKKTERREVRIPVQDFSLTDQNNRPLQFEQLKGRVMLLAFAYTTCPDVCPLVTAAMHRVQSELGRAEKNSVYFLTITTDPEIDSPPVLAAYAKRYGVDHSNWAFLTGATEALAPVWKTFGVKVLRKSRGLIDHTPLTALIDQQGVIRVVYVGPAPDSKVILEDLRYLIRARKETG